MEILITALPLSLVCSLLIAVIGIFLTKSYAPSTTPAVTQQKLNTGPTQAEILQAAATYGYDLTGKNKCCAKAMAFDRDGRMWIVGTDDVYWYRLPGPGDWIRTDEMHLKDGRPVLSFDNNNILTTVGSDNFVYTKKTNEIISPWSKTSAAFTIDVCWRDDGYLYAIDVNHYMKRQATPNVIKETWQTVDNTAYMMSFALTNNGRLYGISGEHYLYTKVPPYTKDWIPTSVRNVKDVAVDRQDRIYVIDLNNEMYLLNDDQLKPPPFPIGYGKISLASKSAKCLYADGGQTNPGNIQVGGCLGNPNGAFRIEQNGSFCYSPIGDDTASKFCLYSDVGDQTYSTVTYNPPPWTVGTYPKGRPVASRGKVFIAKYEFYADKNPADDPDRWQYIGDVPYTVRQQFNKPKSRSGNNITEDMKWSYIPIETDTRKDKTILKALIKHNQTGRCLTVSSNVRLTSADKVTDSVTFNDNLYLDECPRNAGITDYALDTDPRTPEQYWSIEQPIDALDPAQMFQWNGDQSINMCMGTDKGITDDKTLVGLFPCYNDRKSSPQLFKKSRLGQLRYVNPGASDPMCVTADVGGEVPFGTTLTLRPCDKLSKDDKQLWVINDKLQIQHKKYPDRCIQYNPSTTRLDIQKCYDPPPAVDDETFLKQTWGPLAIGREFAFKQIKADPQADTKGTRCIQVNNQDLSVADCIDGPVQKFLWNANGQITWKDQTELERCLERNGNSVSSTNCRSVANAPNNSSAPTNQQWMYLPWNEKWFNVEGGNCLQVQDNRLVLATCNQRNNVDKMVSDDGLKKLDDSHKSDITPYKQQRFSYAPSSMLESKALKKFPKEGTIGIPLRHGLNPQLCLNPEGSGDGSAVNLSGTCPIWRYVPNPDPTKISEGGHYEIYTQDGIKCLTMPYQTCPPKKPTDKVLTEEEKKNECQEPADGFKKRLTISTCDANWGDSQKFMYITPTLASQTGVPPYHLLHVPSQKSVFGYIPGKFTNSAEGDGKNFSNNGVYAEPLNPADDTQKWYWGYLDNQTPIQPAWPSYAQKLV